MPAAAQQPPAGAAPAHSLAADGTRFTARRLTYRTALIDSAGARPLGDVDVESVATVYAGAPSWLLVSSGMRGTLRLLDSLFLARADLRPQHWSATLGLARLAAEFTSDSIFGATSSPAGRQNVVLPGRPDLLVNEAMVDAVLSVLPLAAAWSDSAFVLNVDVGGSSISPTTLTVESQEQVTVPAGTFDAWIVSLESERGAARLWVAVGSQVVLKSEQILLQYNGALLQRVLMALPPT